MVRKMIEVKIEKARRKMSFNSQEFQENAITFDLWSLRDEYYRGLIEAYTDVLDLLS